MGDFYLLPAMHPVKFGKEILWPYIRSPFMIWDYLESKYILDEKRIKTRTQDRWDPYHKELLRYVSMKYYIFEFLPE